MTQQELFFRCADLAQAHVSGGNPNRDTPTYRALFDATREWMRASGWQSSANDDAVHNEAHSFILAVHAW